MKEITIPNNTENYKFTIISEVAPYKQEIRSFSTNIYYLKIFVNEKMSSIKTWVTNFFILDLT